MSRSPSTSLHPLITQTLVDTSKYYCPYHGRGFCRNSNACNFSHDSQKSTKIPVDYCHFYLANQCLYGQDCKFRHNEPNNDSFYLNYHDNIQNSSLNDTNCPLNPAHSYDGYQISDPTDASQEHVEENSHDIQTECENQEPDQIAGIRLTGPSVNEPNDLQHSEIENIEPSSSKSSQTKPQEDGSSPKDYPLCPYSFVDGECPYPEGQCTFLHGLVCDLCLRPCLHPYDDDQRISHRDECLQEYEREMELSFAIQRSKDKICGICMDTVSEKKPITLSRFGILEKCNHIFCLDCIRKWRCTKQFDNRTIRACPECRVNSDFVVPSKYWIEDQEDKERLIQEYKAALRYFDQGKGTCPFAGSCFYKHAYPDGRLAVMEARKSRRKNHSSPRDLESFAILVNYAITLTDDDSDDDELESLYMSPDYGTDYEEDQYIISRVYDL